MVVGAIRVMIIQTSMYDIIENLLVHSVFEREASDTG